MNWQLTILIIFGLIGFLILRSKRRRKKELEIEQQIIKAHEKLGFPEIDKETQLKMIIDSDYSPIKELTPEIRMDNISFGLIRRYLTIKQSDLKNYLMRENVLSKFYFENAPNEKHDGRWIKKINANHFDVIDQERGIIHKTWTFYNFEEVADFYATEMSWILNDDK